MRLERSHDRIAWDNEYDDEIAYVLVTGAALTRRAAIDTLVQVSATDWSDPVDPATIDESKVRLGHFRDLSPDGDEGVLCRADHPDAMRFWAIRFRREGVRHGG